MDNNNEISLKFLSEGKESALILIDLQTDYVSKHKNLLKDFPNLPKNVTSLLAQARIDNMPIIHIYEIDSTNTSLWIPWWKVLHSGDCLMGEGNAEPWAQKQSNEIAFFKDTYDAFLSSTIGDELEKHLKSLNITRVFMCGVLTKACVMFTANSAFTKGFEVFIIEDCCGDSTYKDHKTVLDLYNGYHIKVVESSFIFNSK